MNTIKYIESNICSADRLNDDGIPSASIAIQHPTGEIETHVITNGAENADTIYQAASISKAITGLAVAKLVDEGKLSYDTKVYDLVPEGIRRSITPHALLRHVTVAHLLSHRSGLSRHGMPGYPDGQPLPSYEEMFAGVAPSNTERIRFLSFPGAQFSYSGGGLTLLQVVLERVTGLPFSRFMRETLLQPLGMTRSHYGDLPEGEENFTMAHYTAYTRGTQAGRGFHRFVELAAAGLWTTPTDLTKALVAVQRSLQGDGGFLSTATAKTMITAVEGNDEQKDWSMGWDTDGDFFAHSGDNDPGYACYAVASHGRAVKQQASNASSQDYRFDSGNTSVVIMTDADGWSLIGPTMQKLMLAIFFRAGWSRVEQLPSYFGSFTELVPYAAPRGTPPGEAWRDWVGKWSGGWEIFDDAGTPMVRYQGIDVAVKLLPAAAPVAKHGSGRAEHIFVAEGLKTAFWLTFDHDEQVVGLVQEQKQILKRLVS